MAKFYSKEEIEFLEKYAPKIGVEKCAEKLGRSISGVQAKLNRLKIPSKIDASISEEKVKEISFKSQFKELEVNFNKTSTPKELAYFLGFFWADGYVREKDNNLIIEIVERDALDLKPIFDRVATFSIYRRERENRQPQVTFRYSSKDLIEYFISLGKYAKSTESHSKILDAIPEDFQIYFLRGLIDGDGNFYSGGKGAVQFSIAASIGQDWSGLKEKLESFGLNLSIQISETDNGSSSRIRCSNSTNIKNFIKKLYKVNDGIWLNRKHDKALFILNT